MTATEFPAFKNDESRARYWAAYETALQAWPVLFDEIYIPTTFGPTHIIASGPTTGPPLVLLPSFAGTATVWRTNVAQLSRDNRVYAIDVIGQPGKSVATRAIRASKDYADWLSETLDGLGVDRTSLAGCSFGAFVALNQALLTPERVDRVVLISPAGVFASQFWRLTYAARIKTPLRKWMRRITGNQRGPSMADLGARPRDVEWARLMAITMSVAAGVSMISPTVFSRRQLMAIRAPTLLLIGDRETLYDANWMFKRAAARMPAIQSEIVRDADHIGAMAQPDEVNGKILRFLKGG